jgi:hypothetical protein
MKIPPNGPQGQHQRNLTGYAEKTDVVVKARVAPGLFFISVGGRDLYARTVLDLIPGESYRGILQRSGDTGVLQLEDGASIKIAQILDAYREESGVPRDSLSDLLLSRYLILEKGFDPVRFRRLYLQLSWLISRFSSQKNSTGGKGGSAEFDRALAARVLIVLDEKNVRLSDEQIVRFISLTGRGGTDTGDADFVLSPRDYELLHEFNQALDPDGHREGGWIVLPLESEDAPGRQAFLRYNLLDSRAPISCSISGWDFLWYPEDAQVMYYRRPSENVSDDRKKQQHFELLKHVKAVNFERVEEIREIRSFDGFTMIGDSCSVRIDEERE